MVNPLQTTLHALRMGKTVPILSAVRSRQVAWRGSRAARSMVLRSPLWIALLLSLAGWFFSSPLGASEQTAQTNPQLLVEQTTERLLAAFDRDREAIRQDPSHADTIVDAILSPHVDYERVSRLILGKYWRQATPEQRRRFMDEFRALQVRTYAIALTDHADVAITYLPTRPSGRADRALVRTQIPRREGTLVSVDYRLHQKDGAWKVYDVLVEGISLLTNYRVSIGAQIEKFSVESVIEQLAAKNR